MQNGNIVEKGNTSDVFENPEHPYTQKLLNAEPKPKEIINRKQAPLIEIENLNVFFSKPSLIYFQSKFY